MDILYATVSASYTKSCTTPCCKPPAGNAIIHIPPSRNPPIQVPIVWEPGHCVVLHVIHVLLPPQQIPLTLGIKR